MERTYYGMVEGHVAEERGIVDAPIGRSTRHPDRHGRCVRTAGQRARVTRSSHASEKPHAMTLLRLQLDTGRTTRSGCIWRPLDTGGQ